jgi:glycosyltransferase involved in cell wall biosynthesis
VGLRSRWADRFRASIARRGWLASLRLGALRCFDPLIRAVGGRTRYERWLADQLRAGVRVAGSASEYPLISVLLPACDPDLGWLERALDSVCAQSYEKWELCVVDDASQSSELSQWLAARSKDDPRVRSIRLEQRVGISAATNTALERARGSHFALLDHDDELTPDALFEMAAAIRELDADLLYSDEDKIDSRGRLRDPAFKPDFSPDWLLSCNFVSHLGVYRSALARELGGFRSEFDGSQDYDLALRFSERSSRIHHVPRVLYHWRIARGSTADPWTDAKPWAYDAARRAIAAHLQRTGVEAEVSDGPGRGFYRVRRILSPDCRVSLIVSGDGQLAEALAPGEASEVIVAEGPSPSAAQLNAAAASARGDVLVFVDGRLRATREGWLSELASQAIRAEVGCVGTRISARGHRVLHAGVVLGGERGVRMERLALFGDEAGPMGVSGVIRNASAVSGGCLAARAAGFRQLGGFDEGFGSSLFDVDFCLRAADAGLRVVYDPYAELRAPRPGLEEPAGGDVARLLEQWAPRIAAGDPYYNPAFGPTGLLYEARLR